MKLAASFSRKFIEGFVSRCSEIGLDANTTEELFQKAANNQLLATPNVYQGFRERLNQGDVPLTKAAMARYLTPDILSLVVDCHIKYSHDPMSGLIRESLGLPDPSWETVPEGLRKTASRIGNMMHSFQGMPLNQQVLLAALIGGGAGGVKRMVAPSADDQMNQRGALNRFGRGALRGGAIGAGAGLGAGLGGRDFSMGKNTYHPGMMGSAAGAAAGGLGMAALTS